MKANGCEKFEDLMARYVHGGVLRHEREELDRHLERCADCTNLYREVAEADRLIRSLPADPVEPPPWLHARIMANLPEEARASRFAHWGGWAWSLAATSVGAVFAVLLLRGGQAPVPTRVASVHPQGVSSPAREAEPGTVAAPAPSPEPAPVPAASPRKPAAPVAVASAEPQVRIIREVKIYLYFPTAQRVAVTGDFNGWDTKGVELRPVEGKEGMWETDLQLTPGAYAYNFIVDGDVLVPDPESLNQMPDGFGGTNSILLVKEGAPT